eukprot:364630-Chlamydomonas_euryale.AAC.8
MSTVRVDIRSAEQAAWADQCGAELLQPDPLGPDAEPRLGCLKGLTGPESASRGGPSNPHDSLASLTPFFPPCHHLDGQYAVMMKKYEPPFRIDATMGDFKFSMKAFGPGRCRHALTCGSMSNIGT